MFVIPIFCIFAYVKVKKHIENEYAAGCARVSGGCVAYHGALQYYALQTQQFNTIYLHSDKRFRPFVIDGVAYEYHPLKFTYNIVNSHQQGPGRQSLCRNIALTNCR